MQLRSGALSGGSRGQLEPATRPHFEEGVSLVFRRWTALLLALEGEWGGPTSSEKAQALYEDTLDWFYKSHGARACARHPAALTARDQCLTTGMLSRSLCRRAGLGPGRGL